MRVSVALIVLVLSAALSGCDWIGSFFVEPAKPYTPKSQTQTKTEPKKEDQAAKSAAPAPRKLLLTTTPPVNSTECLIKLTAAAGNVPAILQIATYADRQSESYPSVFIQAVAPSGKIDALKDQALAAKVYVARGPSGPFFSTPDGQSAQVVIKEVTEQQVKGEISNAALVDQASGQSLTAAGEFSGKLR